MKQKYYPILITEEAIQRIRSKPGRGHITREEIEEVTLNPEIHRPNSNDKPADRIIFGQAFNGKRLVLYVKILSDDERYACKLITARPW